MVMAGQRWHFATQPGRVAQAVLQRPCDAFPGGKGWSAVRSTYNDRDQFLRSIPILRRATKSKQAGHIAFGVRSLSCHFCGRLLGNREIALSHLCKMTSTARRSGISCHQRCNIRSVN